MHTCGSKRLLLVAATLLLVTGNRAVAQSTAPSWLNQAVTQKQCPTSPISASTATIEQLQQRIVISGKTLHINGTDNSDYIRVSAGAAPQFVRVTWNGYNLGPFGPVKSIDIEGNGGDDVLIVDFNVKLPAHLDGGPGDDCLQGDSAGGELLGGPGDDVLIAGTGRPWINGGSGNDTVVVPQPMGTLRYAPGTDSKVLSLLGQIYNLEPMSASPSSAQEKPDPIILGPSDLGDEQLLKQMQQDIAAEQSVIETDATEAQLEQLRLLLKLPAPASETNSIQSALAFFRRDHRPGTKAYDNRVGYFASLPQQLDEWTIQLLSQVFSATAIVPKAPSNSAENDLQDLAETYTSSFTSMNYNGYVVQIVNSVWAVRSFMNDSDFYYALQAVDYRLPSVGYIWYGYALNNITSPASTTPPPVLIGTSPASTECIESTTSETNWGIGGSAGWQQGAGLNAILTGGVGVSNSTDIICPRIQISNASNPGTQQADWVVAGPSSRDLRFYTFYNQWIWKVPFASYKGENYLTFRSLALQDWNQSYIEIVYYPSIPVPFGQTFELQKPVLLSADRECVMPGRVFGINGTGLYPSLVSNVLVGGTELSSGQYEAVRDTLLEVVAPNQARPDPQPVVVQTGEGFSNDNVSILIQNSSCP